MKKALFLALVALVLFQYLYSADNMAEGRKLIDPAVKNEDLLEKGIEYFNAAIKEDKSKKGVATTYIGCMTMIRAKHTIWPNKQISYVNEGIDIMNKGISYDPSNLESIWIFGNAVHQIPAFVGKKELAIEKLNKFAELVNEKEIVKYDKKMMKNALTYILKNIDLKAEQKEKLIKLQSFIE